MTGGHDRIVPDPQTEAVLLYVEALVLIGRTPNRGVVFGPSERPDPAHGSCAGYLLADPMAAEHDGLWLLLDDGRVWHEAVYETDAETFVEAGWVDWPSDRLAELLAWSLADLVEGGEGGLAPGSGEFHVRDRRR